MCKTTLNNKSTFEVLKEAFGIKSTSPEETTVAQAETTEETTEPEKAPEEWIWVNGYKGMDKNMQCHGGFQYEVGKRYDMPEDAEIQACSSGFHMCMTLDHVFNYIIVGGGNRFFEVKALVRKSDKHEYGSTRYRVDQHGWSVPTKVVDKLAAKSIEIIRELTADEILERWGGQEWDEKYKQLALSANIKTAINTMNTDDLTGLGYSLPFASWLVDNKKYDVAMAIGSQTDLSMDMKCLMIMNG